MLITFILGRRKVKQSACKPLTPFLPEYTPVEMKEPFILFNWTLGELLYLLRERDYISENDPAKNDSE